MPCRVADVFEIVVFAAGTHTALRRNSAVVAALVFAKKDIFELNHACIGKKQSGIVSGHQW